MLRGDFGLDAPPGVVIARDDDFSSDGNAHPVELLVVFRNAIVHVNERRRDIAIHGIRVIGRKLLGLLRRCGILRDRRLLQPGHELRSALEQLDGALARRREEHVELLDLRVQAEFPELGSNPFSVLFVVGRAYVVGMRGKALHIGAQILRAWNRTHLFFPLAFHARRFRGIPEQWLLVGNHMTANRREREARENKNGNGDTAIHSAPSKGGRILPEDKGFAK
jgi:hypothetical protein